MTDQNQFDQMLLDISGKNAIVKCEPFYFRTSICDKFNDTHRTVYEPINQKINDMWKSVYADNKPISFTMGDSVINKLQEKESKFKQVVFGDLIKLKTRYLPKTDCENSDFKIRVSRNGDKLKWNVSYTILSNEFLCLSIGHINNGFALFYVDSLNNIHKFTSTQSKILFSRFSISAKKSSAHR